MKRISVVLAAVVAVAVVALLSAGAGAGLADGKMVSVTGEVIDSACYIKAGSKGADHAKCAELCAKSGIPLALLTDDGKVVWVSASQDMEGSNPLLEAHVAKRVTVEGEWFERGGTKLLAISKVTPAPAK